MTTELSENRAADRKKMAAIMEKLIVDCGSTFTRREGGDYPGKHCIQLLVSAPGGLCVTIEFDGKSCQPNVHVLSWHMGFQEKNLLNEGTFGGNVNKYHRQKATYIAYGFENLCEQLKSALLMCKDGTAYLPETAVA